MTYKRTPEGFKDQLQQRADELGTAGSFHTNEHGHVTVDAFPAFTFACKRDAERFVRRVKSRGPAQGSLGQRRA
jgi:hypothetical protein